VTHLMGADLSNIVKTQKLTDDHVQFLVYQLLRGLKVSDRHQYHTVDFLFIFLATLWNGAGHYIFPFWFLSFCLVSFFLSFFPRLISAAADRMSTILPHMVWP